jgi:general secretion pathway protein M
MRAWLDNLAPRERLLVIGGAVLVALMLLWGALLAPLYGAADSAASRVEMKRELVNFLTNAAAELRAAGNVPEQAGIEPGQSLVVVVARSAAQAGLDKTLTRNQPVGEDGVRVRFENVPFDGLARWLGELNSAAGLAIDSASFDRTRDTGRVNASLVLRQSLQ